ncbi:hypothetical protein ABL78_4240 [Leptomonas seymouri]|uniref:Uncharacterized protein n=1 Tax=Leptomonas seymouri TaxID=5684 RepID=A0A0N1IKE8_LEPSE|nr:hypothetical protein ABL78_4240 [Leptomonas seymouri]|eukprot:KPI86682.1 hypothetical protein ABL78_4240 [Leptomonas seymouri]
MPRIQSRLHADELRSTRQALATAAEDIAALQQQVKQQQKALEEAEAQSKYLSEQLAQAHHDTHAAHAMLTQVPTHYEERERRLQDQVRRMELDIHTLEEMVQAARRREVSEAKGPCEECVQLRAELRRAQEEVQRCNAQVQANRESSHDSMPRSSCPQRRAPEVSAGVPKTFSLSALAAPSARSSYWQEQLLHTTQEAAACFGVVQCRTRDLRAALCSDSPDHEVDAPHASSGGTSATALEDSAERWRCQLQHLQGAFDEVVQADAKLISFLLLTAEQQSEETRRLHQQWSEAQQMVREVERVLEEAQVRVQEREQEAEMLRRECATLTDEQLRYKAQINAQLREMEANRATLQASEEDHKTNIETCNRQIEALTARLAQSTKLQQHATSYAHRLEAALQEQQHLLEGAVAAHSEQQKQQVRVAMEAQVAQFMAQLRRSAQQLQSSLARISSPPTAHANDVRPASFGTPLPKTAPSVSSPEPSPPGVLSAAGVSMSPSVTDVGMRSPSSVPYDNSISLADLTQPFSFGY